MLDPRIWGQQLRAEAQQLETEYRQPQARLAQIGARAHEIGGMLPVLATLAADRQRAEDSGPDPPDVPTGHPEARA
jgi:hypothetical protein